MGTFGPADIIRTFEFELNAKLRRGRPSLLPTPCESHRNMPPEKATVGVTMAVSVASDRSAPKDEHRHFIVSEATRGKSPDFLLVFSPKQQLCPGGPPKVTISFRTAAGRPPGPARLTGRDPTWPAAAPDPVAPAPRHAPAHRARAPSPFRHPGRGMPPPPRGCRRASPA